jgi:hypothetical protein
MTTGRINQVTILNTATHKQSLWSMLVRTPRG